MFERGFHGHTGLIILRKRCGSALNPFPYRTLSVQAFADEMKRPLEIQQGRVKSVKELRKLALGEFTIVYSIYLSYESYVIPGKPSKGSSRKEEKKKPSFFKQRV